MRLHSCDLIVVICIVVVSLVWRRPDSRLPRANVLLVPRGRLPIARVALAHGLVGIGISIPTVCIIPM